MGEGAASDSHDVWVCYTLAALLGCFTRGVTGFGAAIAVLSVWACFAVFGAQVGPLAQVVALEGFIGMVTTLPMLFMVDVKGKASWLVLGGAVQVVPQVIPLGFNA